MTVNNNGFPPGSNPLPPSPFIWWNPTTWFTGGSNYTYPTGFPNSQVNAQTQLFNQTNASSLFGGAYGYQQPGNFWYPPPNGQGGSPGYVMMLLFRILQAFPFLRPFFNSIPGLQPPYCPPGPFPPHQYLEPNANGQIVINGTNGDDTITFGQDAATPWGQGDYFVVINGEKKYIRPEDISRVEVYGGAGNDTIDASAIYANGLQLHGNEGDDVIRGSQGDDVIFGEAGKDDLYGNDGNDVFYAVGDPVGSAKAPGEGDQIWGGGGNDVAEIDEYSDTTSEVEQVNKNPT